jgi:HEAT repeat protein
MPRFILLVALAAALAAAPARGESGYLGKPVGRWIDELKDPQPAVRRGAAFALGKCGSAAALPGLTRALHDADGGVRDAAAYALGELAAHGDAAAVWAEAGADLTQVLKEDKDHRARRSAAFAAGGAGPAAAEARDALLAALDHPRPAVRQNAAWALGRLEEKAGAEGARGLATALGDEDAGVRRDAAAAVGEIGPPAARAAGPALVAALEKETEPPVRKVLLDSLVKVVSAKDKELAGDLARLVKHPDRDVARGVALVLGKIGGPEAKAAVTTLSEALHDADPTVRELASAALANVGEAAALAVPDLSAALSDSSPAVRRNAALALGQIGPKAAPATRALVGALDPKQPLKVRFYAAEALSKVGEGVEVVTDDLLRVFKDDRDPPVRQRVIYALARVKNTKRIPAILEALQAALEETDPRARLVRYDAARLLAIRQGPDASAKVVDTLLAMLKDPAIQVYNGSDAALQTGDERSGGSTDVKESVGGDARFMAAEALTEIGPKANRPGVIAALEDAAKSKDETTRKASETALKAIRGKAP